MRPLALSILILCGCSDPPPSDVQLAQRFRDEAQAFQELRDRLCDKVDKRVVMMDLEWADPKIDDAERAELYALFKRVGAKGVYYDGSCSMRLPVWSVGLGGGGNYKDYSYRPSTHWLGSIVQAPLDEVDRDGSQVVFVSRRLDGDWFLYFHHWP